MKNFWFEETEMVCKPLGLQNSLACDDLVASHWKIVPTPSGSLPGERWSKEKLFDKQKKRTNSKQ